MGSLSLAIVASVQLLTGFGMIWLATRLLAQSPLQNNLARIIEVFFYALIIMGLALIIGGSITGATVL